jgi:PAS domain S-box-containing protein
LIRSLLRDRGGEARRAVIREAHAGFRHVMPDGDRGLAAAVCEALCVPGGYSYVRVSELRPDGSIRTVADAGTSPEAIDDPLPGWNRKTGAVDPDPVLIPLGAGKGAALPVTVEGEPRMSLLVAAPSKSAFHDAERSELAAVASRLGDAISALRLAARFYSLKMGYDGISANLEAEREFSSKLLDLVPLPIVQLGSEGEIRMFNRRCESLTGFRASEALNRLMPDLLIPEPFRSDFRRLLVELFIGKRQDGASFPVLTRTGESVQVGWNFTPVRDPSNGKIAAVLACGEPDSRV